MQESYYFRIDERQNAFDSLQKTAEFLGKVKDDEFYWKWTMIALHNALYGSMVLALQATNPPATVKDEKKSEQIRKRKKKDPTLEIDDDYLIGFYDAYKRIQQPDPMNQNLGSKFACIIPEWEEYSKKPEYKNRISFFSPDLNTSITHLNNYIRNQFLHYYPVSISYGKGGFVEIIAQIVPLIRFLLLECGNVRIDSDEEGKSIANNLNIIDDLIRDIGHTYKN